MKFFKIFSFMFFIFFASLFFQSCIGNANLLLEENASISISVKWPTKLIPDETTDISIFISNDNINSYKKGILINRTEGNHTCDWQLYPGDYTITVLALKFVSNTSSGLKNFIILTGDVRKVSLNPYENKSLSIVLNNIEISSNLYFNDGEVFNLNLPIKIRFYAGNFCSILKFSSGKLYFTYNNGFTNVTEYKNIYVSNTEELSNGYFLSTVYPDSSGYPSNSFDLSVYAKFTVSSDKIPKDFMSYYQINEIKIEISNYQLGYLEDGSSISSLVIVIQ